MSNEVMDGKAWTNCKFLQAYGNFVIMIIGSLLFSILSLHCHLFFKLGCPNLVHWEADCSVIHMEIGS